MLPSAFGAFEARGSGHHRRWPDGAIAQIVPIKELRSLHTERWLRGQALVPFRPSGKPMLVSFGGLSCFLVAGRLVLAGPALGSAKEAVYELQMARLDAQPLPRRLPGIGRRADRAARRLVWPTLSSPRALARQARLSLRWQT